MKPAGRRLGLSPLVSAIMMVLIALIAVGGTWGFINSITAQTQEEADRAAQTRVVSRTMSCSGASLDALLSNTGDAALTGDDVRVYVYQDGDLIAEAEPDWSGKEFTEPGGAEQVSVTLSRSLEANQAHTVEIVFQSEEYTVRGSCTTGPATTSVFGTGRDGAATTTGGDITTSDFDGDGNTDAATYTVTSIGSASVDASSTVSAIAAGDEVLLINLQGNRTHYNRVGTYAFHTVASVSGTTVTVEDSISKDYGDPSGQDIILQRVPHYEDLTIDGGTVTAARWDGSNGGVVAFRVNDTLTFQNGGAINVSGRGYRGGTCGSCSDDWDGGRGEGINGWTYAGGVKHYPSEVSLNNVNGGGGNNVTDNDGGDPGAGGGHGTAGQTVPDSQSPYNSEGGDAVGNAQLSRMYFGGGGGAGADNDGGTPYAQYSNGSSIVYVAAQTVQNAAIHARGVNGFTDCGQSTSGMSGGGAGGTVYLIAGSLDVTEINATGGRGVDDDCDPSNGGETSGDGGDGRIRLDVGTLTGLASVDPDPYRG